MFSVRENRTSEYLSFSYSFSLKTIPEAWEVHQRSSYLGTVGGVISEAVPGVTHRQESGLLLNDRYGEIRSRYPYGHGPDPTKG